MGKLIYCTRTIPEMEKVLEELKALEAYRDECFGPQRPNKPLALGLSSRRNLCVHPRVSQNTERNSVDQVRVVLDGCTARHDEAVDGVDNAQPCCTAGAQTSRN